MQSIERMSSLFLTIKVLFTCINDPVLSMDMGCDIHDPWLFALVSTIVHGTHERGCIKVTIQYFNETVLHQISRHVISLVQNVTICIILPYHWALSNFHWQNYMMLWFEWHNSDLNGISITDWYQVTTKHDTAQIYSILELCNHRCR